MLIFESKAYSLTNGVIRYYIIEKLRGVFKSPMQITSKIDFAELSTTFYTEILS